jgi:hypothetical protein
MATTRRQSIFTAGSMVGENEELKFVLLVNSECNHNSYRREGPGIRENSVDIFNAYFYHCESLG